ncbi:mitochondrial carrier [Irpex rosettiformis]|uniref:Mitochondrial carrier n=1 Tax=Irpex rosettiformis TaxID=378272 RepID=A0ACB8UCV2_9APHY|nr:mitochondrial carrier [Irpex rosettiformis]
MASSSTIGSPGPSRRDIFEGSLSGAQARPFIPRLRSDPPPYQPIPHNLVEFRALEGKEARERRLKKLWLSLPKRQRLRYDEGENQVVAEKWEVEDDHSLTKESAKRLQEMYHDELLLHFRGHTAGLLNRDISWPEFKQYADAKEAELWRIFHDELDLDENGHLEANELYFLLQKAGINLDPSTLTEFMAFLSSSPHSRAINFQEFRDCLLLMPRKVSPREIFRYYTVKKFMGDDGRGAARVTMEGDVTLSAEDMSMDCLSQPPVKQEVLPVPMDYESDDFDDEDEYVEDDYFPHEEDEHHDWFVGSTAAKFLLAGGIAGGVSRTCTAPFDRLKIFLITRSPDTGGTSLSPQAPVRGFKAIASAVTRIYSEGGVRAFWTGNGLSVVKILPESAIKFFTYETSKRIFAKYYDHVDNPRDISGVSRFLSGGMGGISSQLSTSTLCPTLFVYSYLSYCARYIPDRNYESEQQNDKPACDCAEFLQTQMMSNAGEKKSIREAAARLYANGGIRAFYRGLGIGLLGVFPYSAIDMSTFEGLKLAYLRTSGKEEPGVFVLLACGSVSGSIGATSVYPLNLVRTRLQASGSTGHPQKYTGMMDVVQRTYAKDGWRGFYRGLLPTLAKVVPAVSISYVVYESSKRKLGV